MSDTIGALSIPVSTIQAPIGDPLRQKLGEFLQAAIRASCQTAWAQLQGGSNVVERVEINDPGDNTFHTNRLPCLAVFRLGKPHKPVQFTNDIRYQNSKIIVLWVPPPVPQAHRAAREPFFRAVKAAVDHAAYVGRTPGWVVKGDADPYAATEGSHIGTQLGLLRPLSYDIEFDDTNVEIDMMGGAPDRVYPAAQISFDIWEPWTITPATYPAAVGVNIDNAYDEELGTIEDLPAP